MLDNIYTKPNFFEKENHRRKWQEVTSNDHNSKISSNFSRD